MESDTSGLWVITCNRVLHKGDLFIYRVLHKAHEKFSPLAVVCQCGADGLSGDPMDSFNLTPKALGHCLQFVLQWKLPTLVLGGGEW